MSREDELMNENDLNNLIDSDPQFEAKLRQALDVDVPALRMPELPELETEKVVSLAERRGPAKVMWFAMAATVAIAAFLGLRVEQGPVGAAELTNQIIAHLDHEPEAMVVSDVPVSDDLLASVVPANVATMNHSGGLITYAESCPINGRDVPHLVIQGEKGPVTIMLMPHETIKEATPIDGDAIHGILLPVGDGSIAIIGDKEESLNRIQQNVLNSVKWST